MRPRTAPSGILVSRRRPAELVAVCAAAAPHRSDSVVTAICATTNGRCFRQRATACVDIPSMRKPLDKTRAAQSLDENRLTGSLRFPDENYIQSLFGGATHYAIKCFGSFDCSPQADEPMCCFRPWHTNTLHPQERICDNRLEASRYSTRSIASRQTRRREELHYPYPQI